MTKTKKHHWRDAFLGGADSGKESAYASLTAILLEDSPSLTRRREDQASMMRGI